MRFRNSAIYILEENFINRELLSAVKKNSDDEFMQGLHSDMHCSPFLPELPRGFAYSRNSGVQLKIKNVQPHIDPPVGILTTDLSLFGVLSEPKEAYFQVGNCQTKLRKGHWYLFSDALMHSVQSANYFYCVAVQVRRATGTLLRDFEELQWNKGVYVKPKCKLN